jgi:murein DD-endopeptidase MepM/ murein hydrolase activator NlpD
MSRIEQDVTASDELLKSWTREGDEPAVIRSHRAPRSRAARRAPLTIALAFAAGLLSAVGVAQRDITEPASWLDPQPETVIAMAELPDQILDDPALEREQTTERTSRSQRKAIPQPERSIQPRAARWVAPLLGKLKTTSCYGMRRGEMHKGLDLDGETGDTVRSVGAGRVVQVGYRFSGAGLTVTVQHGDTLILYAHLSATSVSSGTAVKAGQKVGELGSTGNSTGSHLHFGVAKTTSLGKLWDRLINPAPWLRTHGIALAGC